MRKFLFLICFALLLTGCSRNLNLYESIQKTESKTQSLQSTEKAETKGEAADLGDGGKSFGEELKALGAYEGYFEDALKDIELNCVSGTDKAFKLEGTTLSFTAVGEETVYSISGSFKGNIVIDVGDDHKFDLELNGFSLVSDSESPITVISGDEVCLKAKKDSKNYIYDTRSAVDFENEAEFSAAIYSKVDLEIGGKGELTVVSENNNGIHSKDDLQVKNLVLLVACVDNSLKGNDSVEIENASTTLIASGGDTVKTSNSDISDKGKQRGTVSISGGTHNLYAACDGIDAAYDVIIDEESTVLNIYTDKYSNYSKEVAANSSEENYIRFTDDNYAYSVKYYNSDTDFVWVNAEYHSKVSGSRSSYYYYSYPKLSGYEKQQFFIYEKGASLGQEDDFLVKSEYLTPNSSSDTFALTWSYSGLSYQWTNYSTKVQEGGFGGGPGGFGGGHGGGGPGGGGPGGFGEGNTDKGEYSTKGIKASNEIFINAGKLSIKSYDDAIHAKNGTVLENGKEAFGNVNINGATITVYSNDDGIHADGELSVSGGTVSVTNAYEGLEGKTVKLSGGYVSVNSEDDGINATATTGTAISIEGGTLYIYCTGDGIDSNSKSANLGIVFSGGKSVIISNSSMNSAIDSENGYSYTAGYVVAVMPRGGMSGEASHCENFQAVGRSAQVSLNKGGYLGVGFGDISATVKSPAALNAVVLVLGSASADILSLSSTDAELNENGVNWR